jgi:hypothetical protein
MPCSSNTAQTCGGSWAMNLFVSTKANAAGLSPSLQQVNVTLPSGWSAASTPCIADVPGRALTGASYASDSMTVTSCLNFCQAAGFQYAGVEYSRECYCGSSLVNGASLTAPSNVFCSMSCAGASSQPCGGSGALNLYQNPSLVTTVNGYVKTACIQEIAGRALRGASFSSSTMTVEVCTAYCYARGFRYAGVEYASQCFCDSGLTSPASLSLTSGQCYMPCAANSNENCGGPNAIQLYINPNTNIVPTVALPSGWTRKGCIAEGSYGRALTTDLSNTVGASTMSVEGCVQACANAGYTMAGVEYSSQCE